VRFEDLGRQEAVGDGSNGDDTDIEEDELPVAEKQPELTQEATGGISHGAKDRNGVERAQRLIPRRLTVIGRKDIVPELLELRPGIRADRPVAGEDRLRSLVAIIAVALIPASALGQRPTPSLSEDPRERYLQHFMLRGSGEERLRDPDAPSARPPTDTIEGRDFRVEGVELPEGPIDPATYRVGPGDLFQVLIWGVAELSYFIPVGPEGALFVPNVGVVDLQGLNLAEARDRLRLAVLDVFHDVRVDVVLAEMRRFKVHVVGAVPRPGSYPATAVTRASEAISLAGGLLEGASARLIAVRTPDGVSQLVDLVGFEITGRLERNPHVSDGAVIEVPKRVRAVQLTGAVVNPGIYEPMPGERLSELLGAVGGLEPGADRSRVMLSRFVADTLTQEMELAYRPGGQSSGDPVLQDGDRFFFRSIPEWHRSTEVFVYGAVQYPGRYPVPTGGRLLSEVIQMAGGFTPRANLAQAHILRTRQEWTPPPEPFDRAAFELDRWRYEQFAVQRDLDSLVVACDFVALFDEGDRSEDIRLQGSDIIQVPEHRGEVRVLGMVKAPGAYPYEARAHVRDYIGRAGGYEKDADKRRTQMARFHGAPLGTVGGGQAVPPGAVLFVPAKEQVSFWRKTRETTTVIVQIASLIVIIDRLLASN
jgi:protein involved in polysaccharide export with SLBB domain